MDLGDFVDIAGLEGFYKVNRRGDIYSVPRVQIMKNGRSRMVGGKVLAKRFCKGYETVCFYVNNKAKYDRVHRVVARAFIPNPGLKKEVNHKDGNKLNNCVENLEWASRLENMQHASRERLSRFGEWHQNTKYDDMKALTIYTMGHGWIGEKIGKSLGMTTAAVNRIRYGHARAHLFHVKPS